MKAIPQDARVSTKVASQSLSEAQFQTPKEQMAPEGLHAPLPHLCRLRNAEN